MSGRTFHGGKAYVMSDMSYTQILSSSSLRFVRTRLQALDRDSDLLAGLSHRPTMELIKAVVAVSAICPSDQTADLAERLPALLEHLADLQLEEGLFSGGDNLVSPPDSAFTINDLCLTLELMQVQDCPQSVIQAVREPLFEIARRAAPAMLQGGVHTPNHRWEIASALVGLNLFLGGSELRSRAEAWLAEGIDIQPDGLYSERSPNYAAYVTNPCLIAMSRRTGHTQYLDLVERNLRAQVALMRPDGMMETVQSRRQDQNRPFDPEPFLSQARLLAVVKGDPRVVRWASWLSRRRLADPARHLAELLVDPRLAGPLPQVDGAEDRDDRVQEYQQSGLTRVLLSGDSWAQSSMTASIYAGSDFPDTGRVASGLANNSTIVDFSTPGLTLETLRISPEFFGLGPLRPGHCVRQGNRLAWVMRDMRTSGYYQPLDQRFCRNDAAYRLTDEGRFFACMDFDRRRRDDLTLSTRIEVEMYPDGFNLRARFQGPVTTYTCLLALQGDQMGIRAGARADGNGVWRISEAQPAEIVAGAEDDRTCLRLSIQGRPSEHPLAYDPGECYTYPGGDDAVAGQKLIYSGSTAGDLVLSARWQRSMARA